MLVRQCAQVTAIPISGVFPVGSAARACLAEAVQQRFVDTNGVRLKVIEAGRAGDPVVVLAHGFPELAYSWRHQIPVLAAAGFHVLAPDQRGYGGSSAPEAIDDYDIAALTADLVGLVDAVAGPVRFVVIGHDWGATVAWNTALLHPRRVAGVAGLSVPPVPRSAVPPTQALARLGPDFYMLRFQRPGVADAELGADPGATIRLLLAGGPELPDWLGADELAVYAAEFTRTGFTGGLNWYRNLDRNWELTATAPATITAPALFLAGSADLTLGFLRPERAREVVVGPYRERIIDGAGHWLTQERPAEVNAELLDFLRSPALAGWRRR